MGGGRKKIYFLLFNLVSKVISELFYKHKLVFSPPNNSFILNSYELREGKKLENSRQSEHSRLRPDTRCFVLLNDSLYLEFYAEII